MNTKNIFIIKGGYKILLEGPEWGRGGCTTQKSHVVPEFVLPHPVNANGYNQSTKNILRNI